MIDKDVNNTEVIVHSGYNEIGGNLVEIRYKKNRVLLDLGLSFQRYKKFYEWPYRKPRDLDELIRLGVVPPIKHIFTKSRDGVNAIFITHAHRDHSDLIQYIENDTPIYIGETAKIILDTREEVFNNFRYKKDLEEQITTLRTGFEREIDNIIIKAVHVDHSIPGAYCFFIETVDSTILYTGDYRLHGGRVCEESLTEDMVKIAKEYGDIDLFITEGTRFSDCSTEREIDVLQRFNQIMSRFDGIILLEYSYLDIDRYESMMEAASQWNKNIVFAFKHFMFLYNLYHKDPGLREKINLERYRDMIYIYFKKTKNTKKKERELSQNLEREGYRVVSNLGELNLDNIILEGFDHYIQDIYELKPEMCIAIHSSSEPYDEESEIFYEKINNWLKALDAPSYRIHSSGHIHPLDLIKIYKDIKPKDVLVIHSEYPEQVRNLLIKSI